MKQREIVASNAKVQGSKKLNLVYGITSGIFVVIFLISVFKLHKAPETRSCMHTNEKGSILLKKSSFLKMQF